MPSAYTKRRSTAACQLPRPPRRFPHAYRSPPVRRAVIFQMEAFMGTALIAALRQVVRCWVMKRHPSDVVRIPAYDPQPTSRAPALRDAALGLVLACEI